MSDRAGRLVLFARAPVLGRVKTRLRTALTDEQCLTLHRALVRDAITLIRRTAPLVDADAEVCFREALRLTPGNHGARNSLAVALFRQGREDEALAAWRRLLSIDPRDPATQRAVGEALAARGDMAGAARHYREVVRLRPDDAAARARLAWLEQRLPGGGR